MLQTMRERMQGIIAGVIVALICITFALWGVQYYLHTGAGTDAVAKIGKITITKDNWRLAYDRARRQMGAQASLDQDIQQKLKDEVLEKMIHDAVLLQNVQNLGFNIGNQELEMIITSTPYFQVDGHFSPERFQDMLANTSYTQESFFNDTREFLLLRQFEIGIEGSAFALPDEIVNAVQLEQQKRDITYLLIPKARFLSEVTISPAAIQDYYIKHQTDFMTDEKVSIQYLQLSADKLTNKLIKFSTGELEKFYRDNIDIYTKPKKWELERILISLPEKANAAEIANARSQIANLGKQAQINANFARLMPKHFSRLQKTRMEMEADFAKEVGALTVGQVSAPFRTHEGYNLVKVVKIEAPKASPFKDVIEQVKKAYAKQQMMQSFSDANNRLSDLTYTNSDSLAPAAKDLDLTIQTTELFTRKGAQSGLSANPKIAKIAFSDAVLAQGYNSSPIEIAPGNVVVLRIKEHLTAKVRPLSEVSMQITKQLQDEAVRKKAQSFGEGIIAQTTKGNNLSQLAANNHLVLQSLIINAQDKRLPKELLVKFFALNKENTTVLVNLSNGDVVIAKLNKVILPDAKNITAPELDKAGKDLTKRLGEQEYSAIISEWFKHTKVERYNNN